MNQIVNQQISKYKRQQEFRVQHNIPFLTDTLNFQKIGMIPFFLHEKNHKNINE